MINKKALENLAEAISELKEVFTSCLFGKDGEALFLRGCFYVNFSAASLIYVFSLSFSKHDVKITSVFSSGLLILFASFFISFLAYGLLDYVMNNAGEDIKKKMMDKFSSSRFDIAFFAIVSSFPIWVAFSLMLLLKRLVS